MHAQSNGAMPWEKTWRHEELRCHPHVTRTALMRVTAIADG